MSTVVNKLTHRTVTLVSFLLTIFTKLRPLKTNLQAFCCLTERIKKGKPTIKVTAEVFSRGLLQRAPAEPEQKPQQVLQASRSRAARAGSGWHEHTAPAAESPQLERHSTSQKPAQHKAPEGLQRRGEKFLSSSTRAVTSSRSCNGAPAPGSWAASATHHLSLEKNHCTQENVHRKIRKG